MPPFPGASGADVPHAAWSGWALLLAGFLILAGAVLGGLRTLLASPLRTSLLAALPEEHRRRWERRLPQQESLVAAAGMLRAACVFAAALVLFQETAWLPLGWRLGLWLAAALLTAVTHEALPALVAGGRGVPLVLWVLPVARLCALPLRPLTSLMARVRLLAAHPAGQRSAAIAAEMIEAVNASGRESRLGEPERLMIEHVLELPETAASQVMTPRTELTAIAASSPLAAALGLARQDAHSRVLVYERDQDHIVGVFYVKDVLLALDKGVDLQRAVVREHMREPFFVPETTRLPALLEEMRRRRTHLAVVVDEYGGTAGVVTVEDILEEIVGEIQDEYERQEPPLPLQRLGPDEAIVEGRISIAALNEAFGTTLPEDEDYDTVAGLLFERFGRIPARGESLQEDGLVLEVLEVDDRRIRRVRVRRSEPAPSESSVA